MAPQTVSLDSSSKYLFLLAHPDDEIAVAGTIRMLVEQGAQVHCAWATSGGYFGKADIREREVGKASDILGLDNGSTELLKMPDLGLVAMLDRAADKFAEIVDKFKPDRIFCNAYEGGHPDHDSVNFLAYEGIFRAGVNAELFEFPLYNATGPLYHGRWRINGFPPGGPPALHNRLTEDAIRARHRMMMIYVSQWTYMLAARLAISKRSLATIGEPYRSCPPDRDHSLPPHEGTLSYERWFNSFMRTTFGDFRKAVLKARKERERDRQSSVIPLPAAALSVLQNASVHCGRPR
jgi:N-acetylglucosamine malate deacetylase 1